MRKSSRAVALLSIALGAFFLTAAPSARAQGCTYQVVAFTGQSAPGGGTFFHFDIPRLGARGEIGFIGMDARLDPARNGVFLGRPDEMIRVVSSGDAVPGVKDAAFVDFSAVSVSLDGGISFNSGISSDGYSQGLWQASASGLVTASGGGGGSADYTLSALGAASFRSGIALAKASVNIGFRDGSVGALFNSAARSAADFLSEGTILDGRLVQRIYPVGEANDSVGSFVDSNESGKVVLKMAVAPDSSPTPFPEEAIYAGDADQPELVAKQDEAAPGVPETFYGHFSPRPSIAANGLLAFSALLSSESGPASGVFSGLRGAIVPKVLEGATVPTTTDVTFGTLSDAVVNAAGDVIFRAEVRYSNGSTRQGIWIQRLSGPPVLVAISGMSLPTPTGPREVTEVDFAGPGTFNDLHQFAFLAKFGEEQGIYLADTRPGIPFVRATRPRRPREFVTTDRSVQVYGTATDETGVEKVEYTVAREASATKRAGGKKDRGRPKRMVVSRIKRARGDVNWNFQVPLGMGLNLISIVATDRLGHESEPYQIRMLRYQPSRK